MKCRSNEFSLYLRNFITSSQPMNVVFALFFVTGKFSWLPIVGKKFSAASYALLPFVLVHILSGLGTLEHLAPLATKHNLNG